ncbi:unnamed protein product [Prorocentrum cordatum]|uniref:RNA helicase n=1 Tax=Prorocentrum cordatum TaxID=2364126 RepID=A0ABN9TM75_9DINO|nr:unnamed protein product [Polarella glacialis]
MQVCSRAVNILTEEELGDLAAVSDNVLPWRLRRRDGRAQLDQHGQPAAMAAPPARSLRGREATMALSRGEVAEPVYGSGQASDMIDGLELLASKEERRRSSDDARGAKAKDTQQAEEAAKQMMSERVIGSSEFKELRTEDEAAEVRADAAGKRKAEEISSSSDGSDGSDSEEDPSSEASDGEQGMPGRLPDGVSGDLLKAAERKTRGKKARQDRRSRRAAPTSRRSSWISERRGRGGAPTRRRSATSRS